MKGTILRAAAILMALATMPGVAAVPNRPHPRLMFCDRAKLERLRSEVKSGRLRQEVAGRLATARRRHVGAALTPEPPFLEPGPERNVAYKNIFVEIRPPLHAMHECALLHVLTQDREIGLEAKRRLLHYAAFDPKGSTCIFHNDEPHMTISSLGAQAYDWVWDLLSPAERESVERMLVTRIIDSHTALVRTNFGKNPKASHPSHELGIITQGSLLLAPEHPELEAVYDYAIDIYRTVFPGFGTSDGGWNEGPSYWTWFAEYHLCYLTEVREATGEDVMGTREFWRNTPYYRVYVTPPGHALTPFGDGRQAHPFYVPTIRAFAWAFRDPVLLWFARQQKRGIGGHADYDFVNQPDSLDAKPPDGLPPIRLFPGVGLVCSHTSLTNPADNVSFFFHSNPMGAISHAHNNQNAFALSAYGEALLINSGHYNVYGSPHHLKWTRQTKASCCVTYDGGVSQNRGPNAAGRILYCVDEPHYAAFAGSCAPAWGDRLTNDVREVVRLMPDTFVIRDTQAGPAAHAYEYNLHALHPMRVDAAARLVTVTSGVAAVDVAFLEPDRLEFRQFSGFDPPVTSFVSQHSENQWHVVAQAPRAPAGRFLTVLQVRRAAASDASVRPVARLVKSPDGDRVVLAWPDGRRASVAFGPDPTRPPAVALTHAPARNLETHNVEEKKK